MDEKEQADRMAAAEALFMISTRVDKGRPIIKTSKRGRKKKAILDDIAEEKKKSEDFGQLNVSRRGRGRRGGGQRGSNGKRGRGGKNNSSPRGRGSGTRRGRKSSERSYETAEDVSLSYDNQTDFNDSMAVSYFETIVTEENTKKKTKTKTSKLRDQRKSSQYSNSSSNKSPIGAGVQEEEEEVSHQAIGFTGATISIPEHPSRRVSFETSQNILGQVSALKQQYNLNSKSFGVSVSLASLPPMNLLSFPSDSIANLPSIPLELESLRLSSQPTPNLSSLGDPNTDGVMDYDENPCDDRGKSEKFLPLKKRKLHNTPPTSNMAVNVPTTTMEASQDSDQDDTYEPMSPGAERSSRPSTPPTRSSFTVQAPPIITMQTLMEIKTALAADEDGDLPLHIAVVHENMRMVIKLINLMKIAGRGVDKFNKQQQTPLHLAVKLDFLEAVDILLKSGAKVNSVDCTGSSAIHMAVQGRSYKCLQMLLDRCPDAEINARNFDGLTPLHTAVDNGDLEQVELLLKYCADIDVTDGKSGRTCLFRAAENNEKAMVELLLRHGANPEVPNYAGVTTAMAVQGRNLHGVLKLLGSVPMDKFSEGEAKSFGAENPAFPGQQSEPTTPRESSLYRHSPERKEKPDSANETKVFQNVFVVSQKTDVETDQEGRSIRENCWSEPCSPGVKMEVQEYGDQDIPREQGLLSLPEGIFRPRAGDGQTEATRGLSERDRRVATQPLLRQSSCSGQVPVAGEANAASAKAISDTSTLTSNQARLYQKLLEMYNIETTGSSAVSYSPPIVQVTSMSQTSSSNTHSFSLSLPRSQPGDCEKEVAIKPSPTVGRSLFVRNPGQVLANTITQRVEHNGHLGATLRLVSQPIKTEVVSAASPPDTPLNLSRPVLSQGGKLDGGAPSLNSAVLRNLPIQRETVLGIRRVSVSGPEKSGDLPGSPGEQYVLLPVSDQQVTSQSRVFNISTLRLTREPIGASSSPPALNQAREGEATTKLVSQKTASLVRDFLNKQQRSSSPLASSSTLIPQTSNSSSLVIPLTSSVRMSAPKSQTVVVSSGQARQVMALSRPAVPADRTYSEGVGVTVSKPTSDNVSTTNTLTKHEAMVIDLSTATSKVTVPQQNLRTFLNSPVLISRNNAVTNQQSGLGLSQGKIVGFSGAILSLPTSNKDRQEQYIPEKVEVKVKEILPKEQQKKRGRKPGKILQDAVAPSETSLSKINSDTDEKLRQFLGAKKNDVLPSVLEDLEKKSILESSSRPPVDNTYKTVGIFSGDVQHVRIGKTYSPSSLTSSSSSASNTKSII